MIVSSGVLLSIRDCESSRSSLHEFLHHDLLEQLHLLRRRASQSLHLLLPLRSCLNRRSNFANTPMLLDNQFDASSKQFLCSGTSVWVSCPLALHHDLLEKLHLLGHDAHRPGALLFPLRKCLYGRFDVANAPVFHLPLGLFSWHG